MIWPGKKRRAARLAITPPTADPERRGLALVIIARNEAARIADWLTFHTLAGASEVFVYDNLSTDDTARICRDFTGLPVTVIPWDIDCWSERPDTILPRQMLAYAHAVACFGARFRWMSFIDTDEFIVPRDHATIPEALEGLDRFANISLPWMMFGHNGHEQAQADPVPFAYTARATKAEGPLLNFKCIVDPCELTTISVHKFETRSMGQISANTREEVAARKARNRPGFVTSELLQLNHYYLMSRQETDHKIAGGALSAVSNAQRAEAVRLKQQLIEAETVQDTVALDFLARHGIGDGKSLRARYQG